MSKGIAAGLARVVPFLLAAIGIAVVWQVVLVITKAHPAILPSPWAVAV